MPWAIRGLIEGFYGRPWTWDERVEVMRFCHDRGMTHYVYAPKDDPKHRDQWREPYDDHELDGFRRLLGEGGLGLGFAISPGLSIRYHDEDERRALWAKVEQVVSLGVNLICLALDDIAFRPGLGEDHAALTTWLHGQLEGRAELLLVPTEYVGTDRTPYLAALAEGVPEDVPIAWTGRAVVNDGITAEQARARSASLGGRPPLLWDNYPVNDAVMGDRLFLGPLWGRDPRLNEVCSGYLANPMVQPHASMLPLASVAGYLRGEDPITVWAEEAGELRVFAEACDGSVPRALVQVLADERGGPGWAQPARTLAEWLQAAATCEAPGLEGEADEWLDQVHREAEVGLAALRLVQATRPLVRLDGDGRGRVVPPDDNGALFSAFASTTQWSRLRQARVSVMGVRCGFRPALGQRADGRWLLLPEALQEDQNAVDHLVRLALGYATGMEPPQPLSVEADGTPVDVEPDGTFQVPPGATVLARCGGAATRLRGPGGPPLADSRLSF